MITYFLIDVKSSNFIFFLVQVVDIERDINKAKDGGGDELVYKTITGLTSDLGVQTKPVLLQANEKSSAGYTHQHGMKVQNKLQSMFKKQKTLFFVAKIIKKC